MEERVLTEEMLLGWGEWLSREGTAKGTIEKYLRDARAFASWLGARAATEETALGWRASLCASPLAPVTVNSMLAAVNGLFRFLGWDGLRLRFLKVQRSVFREPARELTKAEYGRLLDAAGRQKRERLALLLETLCATGIRVSELRYITVEAARRGRAEIRLKGKIRVILLPGRLCGKLLRFAGKQKTARGEIFLTGSGKSLDRRRVWEMMKSLCRAAHVARTKVFPHNLRHLFARCFYAASRDLVQLSDVLGHSSIETTRLYLISTGAEHARTLERLRLIC